MNCNNLQDKEYRKKFTSRLKGLMEDYKNKNGLSSIPYACNKLGIGFDTYNQWVKDYSYTYPGFENLYKLSEGFGVSIDYIMLKTEEGLPKHLEKDLTIKDICSKTELKEDTVLCLCDNSYLNLELKRVLDYLCVLDKNTKKALKRYLVSEDKKEKRQIERQIQDIQDENENTVFDWKRLFINYLALFMFNKVTNVKAKIKEKKPLEEIDYLYLYANTDNKVEIIADKYKIDAKSFENFYLEKSNDYLKYIKQYYLKNDFNEDENLYYFRKKTYAIAKSSSIDIEL